MLADYNVSIFNRFSSITEFSVRFGLLLIDLHTHSYPSSDDSFVTVDELIDGSKKKGLDGICLTDHDAFWSDEDLTALTRKHDFLVVGGSELNTDSGHVLVFGLKRYEFGMHKPNALRSFVDQVGGVIIGAHPYRRRLIIDSDNNSDYQTEHMIMRAAEDEFFNICDAIEGLNGRGQPLENRFSIDLANRLGLKVCGGSDAHKLEQIGVAATEFYNKIDCLSDLITEIKLGKFEAVLMN